MGYVALEVQPNWRNRYDFGSDANPLAATDLVRNKDYKGAPIYKENFFNKDLPGHHSIE